MAANTQVEKTEILEKDLKQAQNGAQVTVVNSTPSVIAFVKSIEWSGSPAAPRYPVNIQPNYPGVFTHLANANFGSKAMVIYTGLNSQTQQCSWVLAWDAPANSTQSPNKVYVACGPKSLIENMPDDQIRMFLDNSTPVSNASDQSVKTGASATINDSVALVATVGANFSLQP